MQRGNQNGSLFARRSDGACAGPKTERSSYKVKGNAYGSWQYDTRVFDGI